jgi:hypothetical protein
MKTTKALTSLIVIMTMIIMSVNGNEWVKETIERWQSFSQNSHGRIHYLTKDTLEQAVVERDRCTLILVGTGWNGHTKVFVKYVTHMRMLSLAHSIFIVLMMLCRTPTWPTVADYFQHSRDVQVAASIGDLVGISHYSRNASSLFICWIWMIGSRVN